MYYLLLDVVAQVVQCNNTKSYALLFRATVRVVIPGSTIAIEMVPEPFFAYSLVYQKTLLVKPGIIIKHRLLCGVGGQTARPSTRLRLG